MLRVNFYDECARHINRHDEIFGIRFLGDIINIIQIFLNIPQVFHVSIPFMSYKCAFFNDINLCRQFGQCQVRYYKHAINEHK